ncbi:MAG: hypothetical protein H7Y11_13165, partial [Armatimonadetes bacterium]|nr:hypothetical protein [Anaerolineae bacterium]
MRHMLGIVGFALCIVMGFAATSPSVTQNNCTAPRLTIGGQGKVLPGTPNRIRDIPSTEGTRLGEIPVGAVFDVLSGP